MPSSTSSTWGPAVAAAIKALRSEPSLPRWCRIQRGGILNESQLQVPAITAHLAEQKPHRKDQAAWKLLGAAQQHMSNEQRALKARYDEVMATDRFGKLPPVAQQLFMTLHHIAGDPTEIGGPNVLASTRVLVNTMWQVFGRKYSPRAVVFAWRLLAEQDFLTVTSGVAFEGFEQARANVYHLLPDDLSFTIPAPPAGSGDCEVKEPTGPSTRLAAEIRMAFRDAIALLKRLRWLMETTGRMILDSDLYQGRASQPVSC